MRRKVLLLTPFAPARDGRHGSAKVIHGLASALAEQHELLIVHLDPETEVDSALASRCRDVERMAMRPMSRASRRALLLPSLSRGRSLWANELGLDRVRRRVAELSESFRPNVLQVEHTVLAEVLRSGPPNALRVVTVYDTAASAREFVSVRQRGLWLAHRLDSWAALRQERRALAVADAAVVFTEADRLELLRGVDARRSRHIAELVSIPLGWEVPALALDPVGGDPPTVLFVGNFRHPPNVEAALRLVRSIFPLVRASYPQAKLEIVGPEPPAALRALGGAGVHVTGAVANVADHLDRAAVVVAPLRLGGGMRVKLLEALAAGKAVVASGRAVAGLSVRGGHELMLADEDAETAQAIVELLGDEASQRNLGRSAREWAFRELSWSAMAERYTRLYDRLEHSRVT